LPLAVGVGASIPADRRRLRRRRSIGIGGGSDWLDLPAARRIVDVGISARQARRIVGVGGIGVDDPGDRGDLGAGIGVGVVQIVDDA